jgi:hypothetical protein
MNLLITRQLSSAHPIEALDALAFSHYDYQPSDDFCIWPKYEAPRPGVPYS